MRGVVGLRVAGELVVAELPGGGHAGPQLAQQRVTGHLGTMPPGTAGCRSTNPVNSAGRVGQPSGLRGSNRSAMIFCWISLVPSKIVVSRASRQ
ncbi:hypothetical protein GCM10023215_55420 [Pseudonocardia yuanmonensis]|uniref:Uncharacterized protein n=1 Tax=Pseudonocardia yuanmonensis TaxID=1095914 RepID=A0ABP8XH25_9PSEU